jgi:hypothetical protein
MTVYLAAPRQAKARCSRRVAGLDAGQDERTVVISSSCLAVSSVTEGAFLPRRGRVI